MSTLTVYPTRRRALKAAHVLADTTEQNRDVLKQVGRRPPFIVLTAQGDFWFTSRTEFKLHDDAYPDFDVVEVDDRA